LDAMSNQASIDISPARVRICDMRDGQAVEAVVAIRSHERRTARNGNDFLSFTFGDASGTLKGVAWDNVDEIQAAASGVVVVAGRYSDDPKWGAQIKVTALRAAADGEYSLDDLVDKPAIEVERLEADLRDLIETVQNPQLRALLDDLLGPSSEVWQRFREAPAAKVYHQAYRHGLLEHTLSVAQAVSAAASYFPGIDRDVAVTGALLHDIGKTMAYNDDPLAIDLTDAGRLQGEIPLGYYLVRSRIERIEGFDPALAQHVLHIILSHHGALEHGSPVVPATREATLVHSLDNLGGKLGSFDRLERELAEGEAWSRFDRALEGSAYFSARTAA
jgi:3'-5' exoribonuclease